MCGVYDRTRTWWMSRYATMAAGARCTMSLDNATTAALARCDASTCWLCSQRQICPVCREPIGADTDRVKYELTRTKEEARERLRARLQEDLKEARERLRKRSEKEAEKAKEVPAAPAAAAAPAAQPEEQDDLRPFQSEFWVDVSKASASAETGGTGKGTTQTGRQRVGLVKRNAGKRTAQHEAEKSRDVERIKTKVKTCKKRWRKIRLSRTVLRGGTGVSMQGPRAVPRRARMRVGVYPKVTPRHAQHAQRNAQWRRFGQLPRLEIRNDAEGGGSRFAGVSYLKSIGTL